MILFFIRYFNLNPIFSGMRQMKKVQWVHLAFLAVLMIVPRLHAAELNILTEEMPPFNYSDENREAAGFSTEIVLELLKRTGSKAAGGKIRVLPWARAYRIILKEKNAMLYSMTRTRERERQFKWVGPIAPRTIWFWKLKERKDIKIVSLEDAKKYRIGAVREFASAKYLTTLGFRLDLCNSEEANFKKLTSGRIDLLTALELAAAYQMKKLNKSFNQLDRLIKLDDRYRYYLALNIDTPDEIVNSLQRALEEMKSDGTYEKIRTRSLFQ
jgi:polar amino acid transport system substrate-binding protein